jgi:hypothetical protein
MISIERLQLRHVKVVGSSVPGPPSMLTRTRSAVDGDGAVLIDATSNEVRSSALCPYATAMAKHSSTILASRTSILRGCFVRMVDRDDFDLPFRMIEVLTVQLIPCSMSQTDLAIDQQSNLVVLTAQFRGYGLRVSIRVLKLLQAGVGCVIADANNDAHVGGLRKPSRCVASTGIAIDPLGGCGDRSSIRFSPSAPF